MSNTKWIVFDRDDLEVLQICETKGEAKEEREHLNKVLPETMVIYCELLMYEYLVRQRELRAQMTATIYAGLVVNHEDSSHGIQWAISQADAILERLNEIDN